MERLYCAAGNPSDCPPYKLDSAICRGEEGGYGGEPFCLEKFPHGMVGWGQVLHYYISPPMLLGVQLSPNSSNSQSGSPGIVHVSAEQKVGPPTPRVGEGLSSYLHAESLPFPSREDMASPHCLEILGGHRTMFVAVTRSPAAQVRYPAGGVVRTDITR